MNIAKLLLSVKRMDFTKLKIGSRKAIGGGNPNSASRLTIAKMKAWETKTP